MELEEEDSEDVRLARRIERCRIYTGIQANTFPPADCSNNASSVNPSTIAAASEAALKTSTSAAQVQASTQAAAPPSPPPPAAVVPVQQTTTSQVEVSTPTPVAPVVVAPQPTLHSSDEQFFYFCDP